MGRFKYSIVQDTVPVTHDLKGWYAADDFYNNGSSPIQNVSNPSIWYDKSGLGNNLSVNGSGSVLTPAVKNGLAAMYLNGSGYYTSGSVARNSGSATSFIVYNKTNTGQSSVATWQHGNTGPYLNWYTGNGNGQSLRWEAGPTPQAVTAPDSTVPTSTWCVAVGRQGSAGMKWKTSTGYSSSQTGEAYALNDSTASIQIGSYAGNHVGNIGEVLMYDAYLSDAEVDQVFNYLRNRWAI